MAESETPERNRDGANQVVDLFDGEVRIWIDQETIMLIAKDKNFNDPTELTETMARKVASTLLEMADRIDAIDP